MKSYNHLWEQLISDENYYQAVEKATKHKSGKSKKDREARRYKEHAAELKEEFLDYVRNYKHRDHKPKEVYDGIRRKRRNIYVPNVKEQILHHMIVNILKPIFMKPCMSTPTVRSRAVELIRLRRLSKSGSVRMIRTSSIS